MGAIGDSLNNYWKVATKPIKQTLETHTRDGDIHVTAAQKAAWNAKADASDIPNPTTAKPKMDGEAAAGTSTTWAHADHIHPTDTSRASASDLTTHTGNDNIHVTAAEKQEWSAKQNALTFDAAPTANSANPVTSGGVKNAIDKTLPKHGSGEPTEDTAADFLGQTYIDDDGEKAYTCVKISGGKYKWAEGGGGGGGGSLALSKIYIDTPPKKTAYKAGETFDPTGMVVKADYAINGVPIIEGKEVTGYTYPSTGLTAGQESITISLTEGGETKTATQAITVTKTSVPVPTVSGTYTFNDNTQTFQFDNEPSSAIATKSGDTSGMNVGPYTTRWTLNDTDLYEWADGSGDAYKEVTTQINKVTPTVTAPTKAADTTYNGSSYALTATAGSTNFGTLEYSTDGTNWSTTRPTAKNAGGYNVRYRVVGDNNINDVAATSIGTVKIAQKAPTLSASPASVTLDTEHLTATSTITCDGDGTIEVESDNESVATASLSGNTVTISHVNQTSGSANITVRHKAKSGGNYATSTIQIAVNAAFVPDVDDASWATISAISADDKGDLYWDEGDCKAITLNGKIGDFLTLSNKTVYVFILAFNHNTANGETKGILWGGFKTAKKDGVLFALYDSKYSADASWATYTDGSKCFTMNHKHNTNYGGWKGCDFRYDILGATEKQPANYNGTKATNNAGYDATDAARTNPVANTLAAALPSDMRAVLKLRTHYVDNVGNQSNVAANVTAVVDLISLMCEYEIFKSRSYANQYEQNKQAQFAYFENGNAHRWFKETATTTGLYVWEASPRYDTATLFCTVGDDGGAAGGGGARYSLALAAAFLT